MKGWTQWEQTVGGMVCRNGKLKLSAFAAHGVADKWVVTVYRQDCDQSAWTTRRNKDEALAAAVALLPRRRVTR